MSINNNIWELAEAYIAGSLSQQEVNELNTRLAGDVDFANEFNDATNLVNSIEGSGKQKRFRTMLRDIHQKQIQENNPAKPKHITLPAHFWRTAAVAASVAILTSAITIWSINYTLKKSDSKYNTISREVGAIKKAQAQQQAQQNKLIEIINTKNKPAAPTSDVKYTGTGFALTNDGYFVTAYHVISDGDSVYIQNHDGDYFKAFLVNFNAEADVAILKVEKKNFRFGKGEVPYTFTGSKAGLGAGIFTLGYPKDEVVYSEGYISAKNGFQDNPLQYTLELPAGHGQSGSPVIDSRGNILGLLTAIGSQNEANTYAVSSKALIELLHTIPNAANIHMPRTNKLCRMSREQQIEKMEAYTFSVKVYKK
jgi:serine protease Do